MTPLLFVALSLLSTPATDTAPAAAASADDLDAQAARARRAIKTCGPVAVCYCLRKSGRDVKLQDVLSRAKLGDEGTSVPDLLELLSSYGMPGEMLSGDKTDLEALPSPAILLIGRSHCVVFEGLENEGQSVRYFEPSDGSMRTVPRAVMSRDWTGEVIVFGKPPLSWLGFLGWTTLSVSSVLLLFLGARYLPANLLVRTRGQNSVSPQQQQG